MVLPFGGNIASVVHITIYDSSKTIHYNVLPTHFLAKCIWLGSKPVFFLSKKKIIAKKKKHILKD